MDIPPDNPGPIELGVLARLFSGALVGLRVSAGLGVLGGPAGLGAPVAPGPIGLPEVLETPGLLGATSACFSSVLTFSVPALSGLLAI